VVGGWVEGLWPIVGRGEGEEDISYIQYTQGTMGGGELGWGR
jgi:hypothetical protein